MIQKDINSDEFKSNDVHPKSEGSERGSTHRDLLEEAPRTTASPSTETRANPMKSECLLTLWHDDRSYLEKISGFLSGHDVRSRWARTGPGSKEDHRSRFEVLSRCDSAPIFSRYNVPYEGPFLQIYLPKVGPVGEPLCGPGGELDALLDLFPDLRISGYIESPTAFGTINGTEFIPNGRYRIQGERIVDVHVPIRPEVEGLSDDELKSLIQDISQQQEAGGDPTGDESLLLAAAELLVARNEYIWFQELGEISAELAEILAGVERLLDLSTIDHLSVEAAGHLAKCLGMLELGGLKKLPEGVARAFGDRVGYLDLSSVSTLSLPAARHLSKHRGILELQGIQDAPSDVIRTLGKHQGFTNLSGLTEIPDSAAEGFASHVGTLDLSGLTQVSPLLAKCLATNDGDLHLRSLTTLSEETAEAFSHHSGELEFRGLRSLSDAACEYLGRHEGTLTFGPKLNQVSVQGLKSLSANRGNLDLSGLVTLCPEGAAALAKHYGVLSLSGLTTLDPAAARALSPHSGPLSLRGLRHLCPDAARALSQHRGALYLYGLRSIEDSTAALLEGHRGPVHLGM